MAADPKWLLELEALADRVDPKPPDLDVWQRLRLATAELRLARVRSERRRRGASGLRLELEADDAG